MPPTAAEIARTLASGRLRGSVTLAAATRDVGVTHATDRRGRVLVVARRDTDAWRLLTAGADRAAVLTVEDAPPYADSPWLGRVRVARRLSRLTGDRQRAAALEFADANPVDDLLGVGQDADLFRIEPAEVLLQLRRGETPVAVEAFAAARPDPFHADERELLDDLRGHHVAEISALLPGGAAAPRPVRLDRWGLVVAVRRGGTTGLVRLEFADVAEDTCCVARALRLGDCDPGGSG